MTTGAGRSGHRQHHASRHRLWPHLCSAAAAAILLASGTAVPDAVGAAPQPQPPADARASPEAGLGEISRELTAAAERLRDVEDAARQAEEHLSAAEAASTTARGNHDARVIELGASEGHLVAAEIDLRSLLSDAAQSEGRLRRLLRERYASGDVHGLSVLVKADSVTEYTDAQLLSRIARRQESEVLRSSVNHETAIRSDVRRVQEQRNRLDTLRTQAVTELAGAQAAELSAFTARQELQILVSREAEAVAALESARADEERRLAELSVSSEALAQRLATLADGLPDDRPAGEGVRMSFPVTGAVTSPFGFRIHPILNYERLHTGIDVAAPCGAPVYAAADGIVTSTGWSGGYGNQLVIDHGRISGTAVATTYSHLTSFVVTGGPVSRGDLVALVGTTGLSTGCHLHFETRDQGQPVDPALWLA